VAESAARLVPVIAFRLPLILAITGQMATTRLAKVVRSIIRVLLVISTMLIESVR
jgi:hypothetical protein